MSHSVSQPPGRRLARASLVDLDNRGISATAYSTAAIVLVVVAPVAGKSRHEGNVVQCVWGVDANPVQSDSSRRQCVTARRRDKESSSFGRGLEGRRNCDDLCWSSGIGSDSSCDWSRYPDSDLSTRFQDGRGKGGAAVNRVLSDAGDGGDSRGQSVNPIDLMEHCYASWSVSWPEAQGQNCTCGSRPDTQAWTWLSCVRRRIDGSNFPCIPCSCIDSSF